jgi:hypothetical protein
MIRLSGFDSQDKIRTLSSSYSISENILRPGNDPALAHLLQLVHLLFPNP